MPLRADVAIHVGIRRKLTNYSETHRQTAPQRFGVPAGLRRTAPGPGARAPAAGVFAQPARRTGSATAASASTAPPRCREAKVWGGEAVVRVVRSRARRHGAPRRGHSARHRARGRRTPGRSTSPPGWSCIPAAATGAARCSTRCCAMRRRSRTCRARASCTGSTRTRAACWSSRRRCTAQTDLVRQLQARTVTREYVAVVHGGVARDGKVEAPDRPPPGRSARAWRWSRAANPPSRTTACVARYAALTLLDCRLETGRTHQIRVHLHSIGHPLVGDPVYAASRSTSACPQELAISRARRCTRRASRLHHPRSRRGADAWQAPLPADMRRARSTRSNMHDHAAPTGSFPTGRRPRGVKAFDHHAHRRRQQRPLREPQSRPARRRRSGMRSNANRALLRDASAGRAELAAAGARHRVVDAERSRSSGRSRCRVHSALPTRCARSWSPTACRCCSPIAPDAWSRRAHAGWRGLAAASSRTRCGRMAVAAGAAPRLARPGHRAARVRSRRRRARCVRSAADRRRRRRIRRSTARQVAGGPLRAGAPPPARRGVQSDPRRRPLHVIRPARFYSYRRDRITGRMAALIWLRLTALTAACGLDRPYILPRACVSFAVVMPPYPGSLPPASPAPC